MKLKKFNENVESDLEIFRDCATIITYEFEQITFEVNEDTNQIKFNLSDWLKGYGDVCVSDKFLEFTPDYIKLIKLLYEFIQSLADYRLYITELPNLTTSSESIAYAYSNRQYITIKYLNPTSKFSFVNKNVSIDIKSFKNIIKNEFDINCNEILKSGEKTLILNGLDTDFYTGPLHNNVKLNKFLNSLTIGDNPLVEFGVHWLSNNNTKPWDEFKKKVNLNMEYPFNINDINQSSNSTYNKLFFLKKAQHINISLTFENNIAIIK